MAEVPFKLSSKVNCTNWGTYMNQHMKTKGPVTEKEHTAFLAYHLAHGNHIGLGKLFLGETYRYLHLMRSNLLNHKKLRTGGPWWFIQLWAQLYFQHHIPNFQGLTKNSFPDERGKPIRCTSYGQALFSLPGSKLNSTDAAN
jgi:hypothetical protein